MTPIIQQGENLIHKVLHHVLTLGQTTFHVHGQTRILPQIRLHVRSGQIPNGAHNEFIFAIQIILEGICGEHEDVRLFGEEGHYS